MQKRIWISLTIVLLLTACRQQSNPNDSQDTKISSDTISQAMVSRQASDSTALSSFQTMGKVVAAHYADMKFEISLPVLRMMVHNGDHVRQGQLLAEQDATRQTNAVEQHQREIEQANIQMQDVIISQGYDPEHMENVPQRVRHIAEVKSGLLLAQSKLAAARHELKITHVVAPFDGIVANVTAHAGQLAQVGDIVCRVISPQQMNVEFRVMEADLSRFTVGTRLQVVPVGNEHAVYEAKVTEVNPIVDEQGTVMLRAHVATPHQLFDGMHVSVLLNTTQP
jgi:RND family efflux transporter MFP subunit